MGMYPKRRTLVTALVLSCCTLLPPTHVVCIADVSLSPPCTISYAGATVIWAFMVFLVPSGRTGRTKRVVSASIVLAFVATHATVFSVALSEREERGISFWDALSIVWLMYAVAEAAIMYSWWHNSCSCIIDATIWAACWCVSLALPGVDQSKEIVFLVFAVGGSTDRLLRFRPAKRWRNKRGNH